MTDTEGKEDRSLRLTVEHIAALVHDGFIDEARAVLKACEDRAASPTLSKAMTSDGLDPDRDTAW